VLDPAGADHRVALVPGLGERFEFSLGVVTVNGGVDLAQVRGDLLLVLVGHEPQARADLVHFMPTSA
jgi:hypothetical protein